MVIYTPFIIRHLLCSRSWPDRHFTAFSNMMYPSRLCNTGNSSVPQVCISSVRLLFFRAFSCRSGTYLPQGHLERYSRCHGTSQRRTCLLRSCSDYQGGFLDRNNNSKVSSGHENWRFIYKKEKGRGGGGGGG